MNGLLRRRVLVAIGASFLAQMGRAQAVRRIAWFGPGRIDVPSPYLQAMRTGLRERGWEEGRNIALTTHFTDGTAEASELVAQHMIASKPELIIAYGGDVVSLHRARPSMPVVFAQSGDPADAGFVQSLARPGGNFTGMTFMSIDLVGKRIEMLREFVPKARRLGVLARPEHPGEHRERRASESIARKVGLEVVYVPLIASSGLDVALQSIARQNCDAMVIFPDGVTLAQSHRIAQFALREKIATVGGWSAFAENGFLMSYGPNLDASFRELARFVDRILRGARPSDLPVELPHVLELVVNASTAKVLGLTIPQTILVRAERVIS